MLNDLFGVTFQELAQECDYKREAECGIKMREYLSVYDEYYVPKVIK